MSHTAGPAGVPLLHRELLRALLLPGAVALIACTQPGSDAKPAARPAPLPAPREPVSLEINGFNYTDLYIDSFEVNGQGGGNLYVSSPTAGGGGSVCCVSWSPDTPRPVPLTVRWTRGQDRWCEQEVAISGPVPAKPEHLGVHFFPDGHIEAELTEDYPSVKLPLERASPEARKASGNTVADERMSRCKNGD